MTLALKKYNLGFTTTGLNVNHMVALARLFEKSQDWEKTNAAALEKNIFQQPKATSSRRLLREFRGRLEKLTDEQLELLANTEGEPQSRMALLAVFKRYRFVADFSEQVLRPKADALDFELRPSDYSYFVESLEDVHPELLQLASSTQQKLRQVTLRILKEGEIVSSTKPVRITPPFLSEEVTEVIRLDDPSLLRPFLVPGS